MYNTHCLPVFFAAAIVLMPASSQASSNEFVADNQNLVLEESAVSPVISFQQQPLIVAGNYDTSGHVVVRKDEEDYDFEQDLENNFKELELDLENDFKDLEKELKGLVKMLHKMGDKEHQQSSFLGILLDPSKNEGKGIYLLGVTPDGPAQQAGLQAADVILQINDVSMKKQGEHSSYDQLRKSLDTVKPGEEVELLIDREGQHKSLKLSVGKRGDYLSQGINLVADDISEHLQHTFSRCETPEELKNTRFKLLNEKLGRYFGTDSGLLVLDVDQENSIGLQEGDVLLKIDARAPKNPSQVERIISSYDKGETITLTLMRDKKQIDVQFIKN